MRRTMVFTALLLAPLAAQAQTPVSSSDANALVASSRALYEPVKGFLMKAAEQVAEEHYGFKPTPDVRSFGELIGHIANAQYALCSAALGSASPNRENIERTKTTKADLVQALKASFDYCDTAYQITDAQASQVANVFGAQQPRLYALNYNVAHNNEHYGNIVTYMRLKGLVPPSSQRGN